jgi:hypothetical protein
MVRALLGALSAEARRDVVRILEIGAQAGWSCADLLALAREAGPA